MPRTAWYPGPINKYSLLKELPLGSKIIRIREFRRYLDRLQFSVRHYEGSIEYLLKVFRTHFESLGVTMVRRRKQGKPDSRYPVHEFRCGPSSLRVMDYGQWASYWFAISVQDPDWEVQLLLKALLAPLLKPNASGRVSVYLSQAEFALDTFPEDPADLPLLKRAVGHGLVIKNARSGFCRLVGGKDGSETMYQGRGGHVRKGAGGLRLYNKPGGPTEEGFVRLEYQANGLLLRRLGLRVSALPVSPLSFDPLERLQWRLGLDGAAFNRLLLAVARKRWPGQTVPGPVESNDRAEAQWLARLRCLSPDLAEDIFGPDCTSVFLGQESVVPVAKQIDGFLAMRKREGVTCQAAQLFPPVGGKENFMADLRQGFVRLPEKAPVNPGGRGIGVCRALSGAAADRRERLKNRVVSGEFFF